MKTNLHFALALTLTFGCGLLSAKEDKAIASFKVTKRYLNLPIDDSQPKRYAILSDAEIPVTDFRLSLADGKPKFWASIELSEQMGKTLTLSVEGLPEDHKTLKMIRQSDELPEQGIYDEKFRPQFHYTPRVGWVNDPNGLFHYKGTWHLFYQWNPYGTKWDNMHWGHATSKDLVHWEDHGASFKPRFQKAAFSGSGVIDWKNTTGLQTGEDPPILLYYTENAERFQEKNMRKTPQRLRYSTDGGQTFKEYEKNPILPPMARPNGTYYGDRDPIVRWYGPDKHWVMVLYIGSETFRIFESENGLDWKQASDFRAPGQGECPDLFEIPVENEDGVKKWIFIAGSGSYFRGDCARYIVGTFDGKVFTPDQDSIPMDEGVQNYSTQTFSDAPDGRRVYLAWFSRGFSTGPYGDMPANAHFRVPWELTLHKTTEGYRIHRVPVKELEKLRGEELREKKLSVAPNKPFAPRLKTTDLDIELSVRPEEPGVLSIDLAGFKFSYDSEKRTLNAFGKSAPVELVDGVLKLRVLRDRLMAEVFANDGTVVMSGLQAVEEGKKPLELSVENGSFDIDAIAIWEMKSMWAEK